MLQEETPKKSGGLGCVFYGCLTAIVLVVLGTVGTYFGVKYASNKLLDTYTDTQPASLPATELTEQQKQNAAERFSKFKDSLDAGQPATLELTAADINALIAAEPELKGRVHVSIDGDQVKGQASFPLAKLGFEGRHLNGSATFKVTLANGVLYVNLESFQVKGKAVPEQVMTPLRAENLAKDLNGDPEFAEKIRKFESIEIKDGKVLLKARAVKDEGDPAP